MSKRSRDTAAGGLNGVFGYQLRIEWNQFAMLIHDLRLVVVDDVHVGP